MAAALGSEEEDTTAWVRGSGRDSSAEGPAHRLLRRRVEARWAPAAADPRPSTATAPSASIPPSASDAPVDSEESRELQEWEAGAAALDEEANELSAIDALLAIPDDECGIAETVGGAEHDRMKVYECGTAETISGAERDEMDVVEGARGHGSPAGGDLCDKVGAESKRPSAYSSRGGRAPRHVSRPRCTRSGKSMVRRARERSATSLTWRVGTKMEALMRWKMKMSEECAKKRCAKHPNMVHSSIYLR